MDHSISTACFKISFFLLKIALRTGHLLESCAIPPFLYFLIKTGFEDSTVKGLLTCFAVQRGATSGYMVNKRESDGGGHRALSIIGHLILKRLEKRAAEGFPRKHKPV